MNRYFFHCVDGTETYADAAGTIYANDADALDHAEQLAKDLAVNLEYQKFDILVVGEDGLEVARVPVSANGRSTDSFGEGSY